MTKFKRIISLILPSIMMIALSSCSLLFKEKEPEKSNAESVLQYIQEKNTDAIYDMLCEELQKTSNIKERIEETFDFIDGDVVSYKTRHSSSTGEWSKNGKAKKVLTNSCDPIETTSGKTYQLVVQYYDKNDFEPELVGIFSISMVENNQDNTGTDWFSKELDIECHW